MRSALSRRRASLAIAMVLAALTGCARNPVTGHRELALMSESQEIALGKESDPQIVAQYGLYDDPELAAYVDQIGQKLAKVSHRPNIQFTFRVIDSPVINAFALPGGYIYITRGILEHMNNEAELAMVMGHEIGHVTARHGVKQYSRAQIAGLGLGLGSIFVPQVARFGQIAQSALQLVFLKYGRDDETQADELGVEYSLKGGFDATVGTRFFEVLDRMSQESGQSLPTWLSTHPAPADRVKRTHDLALAEKPKINANASTVAEAPHKQRVDGAVFGDDPRQGFTRGSTFLHPSLRFQMTFPRGWQIQNTPSAVLSGEPNQRAVMQMTLEKSEGLTPRRYAERVVQSAQASVVSGGAERIHGFDAYILELSIQSQDGAVPVFAAFVQREAGGPIFQIVGQTASGAFRTYFDDFLQSTRSLQTLTDSEALNMQPNRVKVEKIASSTTLEAAARRVATPVPISTIALLNNLQPNSTLPAGFLVKLVRGNYRPEERTGSGN